MTTNYYSRSDAAILLFDVTNPATLAAVTDWLDSAQRLSRGENLFLVGNKIDLQAERQRPDRLPQLLPRVVAYYEVSALAGTEVDACFERVIEHVLNVRERREFENENENSLMSRSQTISDRVFTDGPRNDPMVTIEEEGV